MKREERNEMIDHRGNEIEQCLKTIEFLSESTEDYLFYGTSRRGISIFQIRSARNTICRNEKNMFIRFRIWRDVCMPEMLMP